MVAIRRHNPNLRVRSKKNGGGGGGSGAGSGGNMKYVVRIAFWSLLGLSLLLAGYLMNRVGNAQQQIPLPSIDSPKMGGTDLKNAKNPHHVHMGDEHAGVNPHVQDHPKLRRPIEVESPEKGEKSNSKGSKSDPGIAVAPDHHDHQDVEEYLTDDHHAQQQASPTKSPTAMKEPETHKELESPPPPHNDDAVPKVEKHAVVLDKEGSGATNVGYVKDFVFERAHPPFLERDEAWLTERTNKASKIAKTSLKSCTSVSGSLNVVCKDPDTMLYALNSANFSRTLCGLEMPPHQVVKLDSLSDHSCLSEPTRHILPHDIMPSSAQGVPPVQIVAHSDGAETAKMQTVQCDVPCSYDVSLLYEDAPRERFVEGEEWKLFYDHPDNARSIDRTAFKRDIYYSTVSRQSSVPVSTFDFDKYDFHNTPTVDWATAERGATYFVDDNCKAGGTRRNRWMYALRVKYPVKSYGACDHDTDAEGVDTMEGRLAIMGKHRLVLAFEASGERDAFTHLTWEAFMSGAVPVVVGPSNALQFLPKNSFLWYGGYNSWDKFADDVVAIADNKTKWESYHAWRHDEAEIAALEKRLNFTQTKVECRTCRWAYAKMYGLNWDAEQQEIKPSTIPRDKFCLSSNEQVSKPFREMWSKQEEHDEEQDTKCETQGTNSEASIETEDYQVTRQVWSHDGVTDIMVTKVEASNSDIPIVLRLEFDVKNYEGAYFAHTHTKIESQNHHLVSSATMQDFNSRVTVLADFSTSVSSPEEGIMEIILPPSTEETRRIRVIIEDLDLSSFKFTEYYPSSFGKKMMLDFTDPIELYYPSTERR